MSVVLVADFFQRLFLEKNLSDLLDPSQDSLDAYGVRAV
jgi:hypothetical protein